MLAEYGIDLGSALWGTEAIGARRLLSLIDGLPPGSAMHRALDPAGSSWGQLEELVATLIEVTDMSNRLYLRVHTNPGTDVGEPIHIPRPWDEKKPATEPEDVAAFFAGSVKVVDS